MTPDTIAKRRLYDARRSKARSENRGHVLSPGQKSALGWLARQPGGYGFAHNLYKRPWGASLLTWKALMGYGYVTAHEAFVGAPAPGATAPQALRPETVMTLTEAGWVVARPFA